MILRADVPNLEHQISHQLPLNRKVVLLRVLGAHVRLKFAIQQDGSEDRPINSVAGLIPQDAVKRIRELKSVLAVKRGLKESRVDQGASTEWRLGAELF